MGAGLDLSGLRRDGTTFPADIALSALDTDHGILISAAIATSPCNGRHATA
jgi:rsbT co-antagonist protein RsbR